MKILGVIAVGLISITAMGQKIVLSPSENVTETVYIRPGQTAESHAYAINNTNAQILLKWKFVSYSGSVQSYDYTMCDKYNCYSAGPQVREVDIAAGDSTFMKFGVVTNCIGGTSYAEFLLWIDGDSAASARTLIYNTTLSDIDCTTGINDINAGSLNIFPNPASDVLTLTTNYSEGYSISISDLSGRIIQQRDINTPSTVLETSSLPTGTYLLSTLSKNGSVVRRKFVKN